MRENQFVPIHLRCRAQGIATINSVAQHLPLRPFVAQYQREAARSANAILTETLRDGKVVKLLP